MSHTTAANLSKRRLIRLLPCVLGGVVLAGAVCAQQPQGTTAAAPRHQAAVLPAAYRVVNLGVGNIVGIPAINDRGQAAYSLDNGSDPWRALFYDGTTIRELGTLGGVQANAAAVNNAGQVAGASTLAGDPPVQHAFLWSRPSGLVLVFAYSISDNGSIVATSNAGLVLLKPDCGCTGTHTAGPIVAPDMVEVGRPFDSTVGFAGADRTAKYNVTWSWGDGSGDQGGSTRESEGARSAVASYTYKAPGIYAVNATVSDVAGNSATVTRNVIVYDKAGTMARGSGMFVSPQGASGKTRSQGGMDSFALIAPSAAAGQLRFSVGTLSFRSHTLKPVSFQGQQRRFEGSGTVNGTGDYRFTLTTTAGAAGKPGRFGLRISHVDPVTRGELVDYDNLSAGPGGSGSAVHGQIVHHYSPSGHA